MKIVPLSIPDILMITPDMFHDERGYFYEGFRADIFSKFIGREVNFVQDNYSLSYRHVLRGLHYQASPRAQGKIVHVTRGEIFDVAVDIRPSSPSFGQWVGEILSAENRRQMWIPEGFAHGFLTLSDEAELMYKVTGYYAPECDRCLLWNDCDVNISWPLLPGMDPILSVKDRNGHVLADLIA